ncbi:hypothetical protein R6Q59_005611 [Mikania micrantha]
MITEGLMESFKENVDVEKNQLLEMRKEIEDDHERKKAELEAMREDIDSQQQNLEAMMQKVALAFEKAALALMQLLLMQLTAKGCIRSIATF